MRSTRRRRTPVEDGRWRMADWLVVAALLAVAAFPIAATIGASGQPVRPGEAASGLPPLQRTPAGAVRNVPVFTPGGAAERAVRDGAALRSLAAMRRTMTATEAGLLTPAAAREVRRVVGGKVPHPLVLDGPLADHVAYPFHYLPPLDTLFRRTLPRTLSPRQADRASDLAGLLILSAKRFQTNGAPDPFPNAASVAFALLRRAREPGGCRPQLNLAFLLSTDSNPRDDDTRSEFERAARACPGDPTPLWLLGEFQSHRAFLSTATDRAGTRIARSDRLRRPFETFHRLQRRFPGSAAGWSGEADAHLRLAYQQSRAQPFTARVHFRRALALYRRARALDDDPDLAAGVARALSGLGRQDAAAAAQRRALAGRPGATFLRARLVDHLERAHRYAAAAAEAGLLAAGPSTPPPGAGLFPAPGDVAESAWDAPLEAEDGQDPLSLGASRLRGISLHVGPGPGGADAVVVDLGFIPAYHDVGGVTGTQRWCPGWSRARDLVLAGHDAAALAAARAPFVSIRPERTSFCPDPRLLAAIADLDSGRRASAVRRLDAGSIAPDAYPGAPDKRLATIEDARQNLFRFGDDLPRAATAVADWRRRQPHVTFAVVQAGEIAFLRGDRQGARREFGRAADRWRRLGPGYAFAEAQTRLEEGAAAALAGDGAQGRRALAVAGRLASRIAASAQREGQNDTWKLAAEVAYHARAQAGDSGLRDRRWALADRWYRAARRTWDGGLGDDSLRPEALANNQAVAEIQLRRPAAGLQVARRAVLADPANPIFLMTRGFAEQRLGDERTAERSYAAAAGMDSTLFPAENDLGVLRARRGDDAGAVAALRRAVGANQDYALGWFNLGVVLEGMGPAHLLSSQGALARAARLDHTFRGREHRLVLDDLPYFTELDLSKPLPPEWQFAEVQRRAPIAVVGLVVVLLIGLRLSRFAYGRLMSRPAFRHRAERVLAGFHRLPRPLRAAVVAIALPLLIWVPGGRAIVSDMFGGEAIERWLQTGRRRLRWLQWALPPALAVAATLAVLLWPLVGAGPTSWMVVVLLAAGLLVLVAVLLRARLLAARRSSARLRHYGWTPSLALGVGATAAGLGWAPVPVAEPDRPLRRLQWLAPAALVTVSAVALVLGHFTGVPLTRSFAASALLVAGSVSMPISPLDGARLSETRAAVALSVVMFGLGLAVLLGF